MAERTNYTLYLTTDDLPENLQVSPVNNIDLANVTWNINWDQLFRYKQSNYTNCRLRFELMSQVKQTATTWNITNGYLTCNLPSNNSATTGVGTPLALLYFSYKRRYGPTTGDPLIATQYLINTTETTGIDIIIPHGNSTLNVKMMNDDSNTPFVSQLQNYQILFHFELYNDE